MVREQDAAGRLALEHHRRQNGADGLRGDQACARQTRQRRGFAQLVDRHEELTGQRRHEGRDVGGRAGALFVGLRRAGPVAAPALEPGTAR